MEGIEEPITSYTLYLPEPLSHQYNAWVAWCEDRGTDPTRGKQVDKAIHNNWIAFEQDFVE